jgi:hypothetical protein
MPPKITPATLFALYYSKMVSRSLKLLLNPVNKNNFKIRVLWPTKIPLYAYFDPLKPISAWRVSCDAANPGFNFLM